MVFGLALLGRGSCFGQAGESVSSSRSVAFKMDMDSAETRNLALPNGASWVKEGPNGETVLKVVVAPENASSMNAVTLPIDIESYRGKRLALLCQARAENVSKPQQSYFGVKCMLRYKTGNGNQWLNQNNVNGTFGWKSLAVSVPVPMDATDGQLILGMQGSSGTVWIGDVKMVIMRSQPVRPPLPAENAVLPPAYKGHNLPRLRGVMSSGVFREKDFADLAGWNVNLVRWQICRNWGKIRQDRDLAEYDQWMDGQLDQLARALDAAQQYKIKIVIDLHTPPGGREADQTMGMFLEKKYQDHFVAVWKKIVTRFKGHPALWAYDLVNEPVQNQPSPDGVGDWFEAQVLAARAIREIDPATTIVFEVDNWDAPTSFVWIEAVKIPNVIYQVHMYAPGEFTHQGVHNEWGEKGTPKLVSYPSRMNGGVEWNKDTVRRFLQPVRDFQRAYNVHIYVGEFSAIRWAPGADKYISDCIDIFEEYGWDWSYHAFREWGGWSVEAADLPVDMRHHPLAKEETARAKVIKSWFAKNSRGTDE